MFLKCSGVPIVTLKIVFSNISFWRIRLINEFQTYISSSTSCINLFLGVFTGSHTAFMMWKVIFLQIWSSWFRPSLYIQRIFSISHQTHRMCSNQNFCQCLPCTHIALEKSIYLHLKTKIYIDGVVHNLAFLC